MITLTIFVLVGGFAFAHSKLTINNTGDPDVYSSTINIIARHGYPSEAHTIVTKDGYLLTLHRIPYSKYSNGTTSRQPVFLQHGLTGCSSDWFFIGNKSLAFLLSDAGYDVWLGNARGNVYSRDHITYTTNDAAFWSFSFHEMGIYDLPAVFSFVENNTNTKGEIIYIGHSMGTTMFFVYASSVENATDTVKMMVALAPVAYMSDIQSPIKYLVPFTNDVNWITQHLGLYEFLPSNKLLEYLANLGCDHAAFEANLCEDLIFLLVGFDKYQFDERLFPMVLSHSPAGTSTRCLIHYAQEIKSGGSFRQYDYGNIENLKRYGTVTPPLYKVANIKVPIYLMSAYNDLLSGQKDVTTLSKAVSSIISSYVVPLKEFNHMDFLWARDIRKLIFTPLMQTIHKYRTT